MRGPACRKRMGVSSIDRDLGPVAKKSGNLILYFGEDEDEKKWMRVSGR